MGEYYITHLVEYEVWGTPFLVTPEVIDEEGNVVEEAVWDVEMTTAYKPKIPDIYKEHYGWAVSKKNGRYCIVQVFAEGSSHDEVRQSLARSEGVYLGPNKAAAKAALDRDSSLGALISSDGMVESRIHGNL